MAQLIPSPQTSNSISTRQRNRRGRQVTDRIPISWLHSYVYCEYQIYLEHIRGVQPEITPEVQEGIDFHASLDEAHKAAAELEITVTDALAKAQEEGIVLSAREVRVEGTHLVGYIDEVVFLRDRILIVDDKPGDIAWPGSKMQTWGYCFAFEEQYKPELPIIAGLRNRATGNEIWAQPFAQEHRDEVLRAIARIKQLLDGEGVAVGTKNPRKCRSCRFKESCDVRLPSKVRFEDELV